MSQDDRFLNDVDDVEPVLPEPQVTPLPVATPIVSDTTPMAPVSTPPAIRPDYYRAFPNETDPIEGQGEPGQQKIDKERREILQQGSYDAFVGRVMKTYYSGTHPTLGMTQGIDVERVDVRWDATTNVEAASVTPSPKVGSNNIVACKPWPARSDQQKYHVTEGDIVTVLRGEDDLYWFLSDDLPFVGTVVVWDNTATDESFEGGANSGSDDGLKVRQQIMSGDPSSTTATLTDKEIDATDWVEGEVYIIDDVVHAVGPPDTDYRCTADHTAADPANIPPNGSFWDSGSNITIHRYVNVLHTGSEGNGYRVGDKVLVIRRGLYLFALPSAQTFLAKTTAVGPDGEGDFADEHYWVEETAAVVTVNTNAWTFSPATPAARGGTGPDGEGIAGRHVDAVNFSERAEGTHDLAAGVMVEVTCWQDLNGDPYYTFTHAIPYDDEFKVRCSSTDDTEEYLEDKILADLTWVEVVTENPDDPNEPPDPGNENLRINHIGPDHDGDDDGKYYIEIEGLYAAGIVAKVFLGADGADTCLCVIDGIRIDAKGHIFAVDTTTTTPSTNWVDWPDAYFP